MNNLIRIGKANQLKPDNDRVPVNGDYESTNIYFRAGTSATM